MNNTTAQHIGGHNKRCRGLMQKRAAQTTSVAYGQPLDDKEILRTHCARRQGSVN
jgi:hypothetical protein